MSFASHDSYRWTGQQNVYAFGTWRKLSHPLTSSTYILLFLILIRFPFLSSYFGSHFQKNFNLIIFAWNLLLTIIGVKINKLMWVCVCMYNIPLYVWDMGSKWASIQMNVETNKRTKENDGNYVRVCVYMFAYCFCCYWTFDMCTGL